MSDPKEFVVPEFVAKEARISMRYVRPVAVENASELCMCGFSTFAAGEGASEKVRAEFTAHECPYRQV